MESESSAIRSWLVESDEGSRQARAERASVVIDHPPERWRLRVFPGGELSMWAFEEARLSYIAGNFLATIVLVQMCVEHTLASLVRMSGEEAPASYAGILRLALERRLIDPEEWRRLDGLRVRRNPYVHSRELTAHDHLLRRSMNEDRPSEDLLADDATEAVSSLMALFGRQPLLVHDSEAE